LVSEILATSILIGTITWGSMLFLISAGFVLIFSVLKIINLPQATFFAYGSYLAVTLSTFLIKNTEANLLHYFVIFLLAAILIGSTSSLLEISLFRKIYRLPEAFQLLFAFGLLLILEDLIKLIWGKEMYTLPEPYKMAGSVTLFSFTFPLYSIVIIFSSILVAVILWYILFKTDFGAILRAVSLDKDIAASLGINVSRVYTQVFIIGVAISALGGAFLVPATPVFPGIGIELIVIAFVVVVSGGMSSLKGALVFSYIAGVIRSLAIQFIPELDLFLLFLLMVIVLAVRQYGLFGRVEVGRV